MTIPIGDLVAVYKGDVTDLEKKLGIVSGSFRQVEQSVQRTGQTISSSLSTAGNNVEAFNVRSVRAFNRVAFGVQAATTAFQGGRISLQGLSGALLLLSPTSAVMAGVAAGLAIVAAGFTLIKGRADAARAATDKLTAAFRQQTDEQLRQQLRLVQTELRGLRPARFEEQFFGDVGATRTTRVDPDRRRREELIRQRHALVTELAPREHAARVQAIEDAETLAERTLRLQGAINLERGRREELLATVARENRAAERAGLLRPLPRGTPGTVGGPLLQVEEGAPHLPDVIKDAAQEATRELKLFADSTLQIGATLADGLAGIGESIGNLLAGVRGGFKNLGAAVLGILGGLLTSVGRALIAFGTAGKAIQQFIKNPVAAIAAGVALVALGAALGAAAQRSVASAGTALAGGGSFTTASGSPGSTLGVGGGRGTGTLTIYLNALPNPNDVKAMDAFVEMIRAARDRRMIEIITPGGGRRTIEG